MVSTSPSSEKVNNCQYQSITQTLKQKRNSRTICQRSRILEVIARKKRQVKNNTHHLNSDPAEKEIEVKTEAGKYNLESVVTNAIITAAKAEIEVSLRNEFSEQLVDALHSIKMDLHEVIEAEFRKLKSRLSSECKYELLEMIEKSRTSLCGNNVKS